MTQPMAGDLSWRDALGASEDREGIHSPEPAAGNNISPMSTGVADGECQSEP